MADLSTPDKAQAPGVVSPATDPNAAPVTDKPLEGQSDLAKEFGEMKTKFDGLEKSNEALNKTLANRRSLEQRRDGELNQLRQFRSGVEEQARGGYIDPAQFGGSPPTTGGDPPPTQTQPATGRNDQAFEMVRWKVDNPGFEKAWPEVEKILFNAEDEPLLQRLAGNAGGSVYGTLDNINGHIRKVAEDAAHKVEIASLKAKVDELTKAGLTRDRQGLNTMAVISGGSVSAEDLGVSQADIDKALDGNMSPQEMLDKGLVPIDPRNPPRFMRK